MRILLVEDDAATAEAIELMLRSEGCHVETTDLGEEAIDLAKLYGYDAILLDTALGDISGLQVIVTGRAAKVVTPILAMGPTAPDERARLLDAGADDVIAKPFHRDELVARLRALVRRSSGHATSTIEFGVVEVDMAKKRVSVGDHRLHLTGKEYALLELLALRKGQTITKDQAMNHLYGGRDEPELKIIDVFVCKLRCKLRKAGAAEHIGTVWGRGYCLTDEIVEGIKAKVTPPAAHPLDTVAGRILRVVADGDARVPELCVALNKKRAHVNVVLRQLLEKGFVGHYRTEGTKEYSWRLCRPGLEWLKAKGHEFERARAAA